MPKDNMTGREDENLQSDVQLASNGAQKDSCVITVSSAPASRGTLEQRYPTRIRKEPSYLKDYETQMVKKTVIKLTIDTSAFEWLHGQNCEFEVLQDS